MTIKTVEVEHQAGAHFAATTGSGFEVHFDSGAGQTAAGPTEVMLAALAACSAMDVVSILEKKRQPFSRYQVHVSAEQRDGYPQVFTRIDLVHELEGPELELAAVRRCIELSATKYCPVSAMLSAGAPCRRPVPIDIADASRPALTGAPGHSPVAASKPNRNQDGSPS